MSEHCDETPLNYSDVKNQPSGQEFVGGSWSVRRIKGRFLLQYISGELAGRLKEMEIAETDFQQLKSGTLSFDDLCRKYNAS
ncbi:MAG TPA: hypothetical protein VHB99_16660 [Pirellulales bacterium]|nr:hypothetical protein [Pirellulales bacterium]